MPGNIFSGEGSRVSGDGSGVRVGMEVSIVIWLLILLSLFSLLLLAMMVYMSLNVPTEDQPLKEEENREEREEL